MTKPDAKDVEAKGKTGIKRLMKPTGAIIPCDPDIYQNGKQVAVITGGSARLIQRFVMEVAEYCSQPVDWHYVGGRARILTTGDVMKVQDAIRSIELTICMTRANV